MKIKTTLDNVLENFLEQKIINHYWNICDEEITGLKLISYYQVYNYNEVTQHWDSDVFYLNDYHFMDTELIQNEG